MDDPVRFPDVAFVIVRTPGGPYRPGDVIALAFTEPSVGRLAVHMPERRIEPGAVLPALVPESMQVEVASSAGPYATGDRLLISFVDARFARIHRAGPGAPTSPGAPANAWSAHRSDDGQPAAVGPERAAIRPSTLPSGGTDRNGIWNAATSPNGSVGTAPSEAVPSTGVHSTILWRGERAARFVRVVDKLFTVDRLGWYRHVLALRLLVPDELDTGNEAATSAAKAELLTLRGAAARTFGGPLLAACMPGFAVTREWLSELDDLDIVRSLAGIRDAVASFAGDDDGVPALALRPDRTVGFVSHSRLLEGSASSESALTALVPCWSSFEVLSSALLGYRAALSDAFAQTADAAEAVRMGAMTQPSHLLDDRLWQLVGAVGETYDGTHDAGER